MDFNQLKTFITAAQTLNFSETADLLGYSQSTISVHIQQLEAFLECQLFERIGRRVFLSQDGKLFYPLATQLINQAETAKTVIQRQQDPKGLLRIGSAESIGQAILPSLITQLHQVYPDIQLIITFGTTEELQELMMNNQIDLVLTVDYLIHGKEWKSLCQIPQQFCFVAANQYAPYLSKMSLDELLTLPFVLTQKSSYRFELEQILANQNKYIQSQIEISDPNMIIQILKNGAGVSFLPLFSILEAVHRQEISLVPLKINIKSIYVQVFHHQNKIINPSLKVFIDQLLAQLDLLPKRINDPDLKNK